MKEKDVNIDSQTEEFFLDNIKKNEILSKIQQIINSEDVNKVINTIESNDNNEDLEVAK